MEPIVLSDKDSDMKHKEVIPTDDNNISKMRTRPEILAEIGVIPEAFLFCPKPGTIKVENLFEQSFLDLKLK